MKETKKIYVLTSSITNCYGAVETTIEAVSESIETLKNSVKIPNGVDVD